VSILKCKVNLTKPLTFDLQRKKTIATVGKPNPPSFKHLADSLTIFWGEWLDLVCPNCANAATGLVSLIYILAFGLGRKLTARQLLVVII